MTDVNLGLPAIGGAFDARAGLEHFFAINAKDDVGVLGDRAERPEVFEHRATIRPSF